MTILKLFIAKELSTLLDIILPTLGYQKTHKDIFILRLFLKTMSYFLREQEVK